MPTTALFEHDVSKTGGLRPNENNETAAFNQSDADVSVGEEINELARRLTGLSHGGDRGHSLFPEPSDKTLNPNNPEFDARKWAAEFYRLQTRALLGNAPNTAGVAFRDLQVYGLGTTMDYQKTVGNFFLEAASWLSPSKKKQRIDILHGLEGVVQSGEMLAVLGPPGSGCSTLLKTIAGVKGQRVVSHEEQWSIAVYVLTWRRKEERQTLGPALQAEEIGT